MNILNRIKTQKIEIINESESVRHDFVSRNSNAISVLRLFLMIMVVYIHSYALPDLGYEIPMSDGVSSFRELICGDLFGKIAVPLFFVISGFFAVNSSRSFKDNLAAKLKSLVIPYLIINSFWIIFFFVCSKIPFVTNFIGPQYVVKNPYELLEAFIAPQPIYYPFWYLRDLILLSLLSILFKYVSRHIPILLSATLMLLLFGIIPSIPGNIISNTSVIYYLAGCLISTYFGLIIKPVRKVIKCLGFVGYSFLSIGITVLSILFENTFTGLLYLIFGGLWLFLIARKSISPCIVKWSKYSFFIYCFHEFYEAFIKHALMIVLPVNDYTITIIFILLPAVVICICIFAGLLLDKKVNRAYVLLTGHR